MAELDDEFDEDDSDEEEGEGRPRGRPKLRDRDADLAKEPRIRKQLLEMFQQIVEPGFADQSDRVNDTLDWWDIYNCKLNGNQFYNGNSQIFIPAVHDAIEARKTRFVNKLFPPNGNNVEAVTSDGTDPSAVTALLEDYIREARLRTEIVPALLVNGDVEGHYNLYVSWEKVEREVVRKVKKPAEVEIEEGADPEEALAIPGEEIDDIETEEVVEQGPRFEVLADSDVMVWPYTADSLEAAIASGGGIAIIRRWSKATIRQKMREKVIGEEAGKSLLASMARVSEKENEEERKRKLMDAAGVIVGEGGQKYARVYEAWTMVNIDGDRRLCVAYYGGESNVLGCRRNPLWCDRLPVFSIPQQKLSGVFKGQSRVKYCAAMQYAANDAMNEGMDSAAYALLPIVMTDPERNPRVGSMVLAQAAIWETSPKDTQFAQFPQLWKEALGIVASLRAMVSTTFSVNPATLTQQNSTERLTQAEIANEQQIAIMSSDDVVGMLEDGIFSPVVSLIAEMDAQYRDEELTVREYGEMGMRAAMQTVPPLQMGHRYQYRWFGVEAARNAQQIQQQIAAVNIVRGIPPQQYPGYQLNLAPAIVQLIENTFGPRLAPLVFKDMKSQLSVEPALENKMLSEGFDLDVHPTDDDMQHMQAHMQLLQTGDPYGVVRKHLELHKQSVTLKAQAAMLQNMAQAQQEQGGGAPPSPGGAPGAPPGAPPQGGASGGPRMGAQPGTIRNGQQPPGAIHPDQMRDPRMMPQ